MEWLGTQGYGVWVPIGHSPDCDLIADNGEQPLRVQVKTTTHERNGRWVVAVCTRGGNRSWNGVVKRLTARRCDWLFVLTGGGRRWFIPADDVEGGSVVLLGGPKYSAFEIDRGRPLPSRESP
jgi:PD-(D/E)XK endonuclease